MSEAGRVRERVRERGAAGGAMDIKPLLPGRRQDACVCRTGLETSAAGEACMNRQACICVDPIPCCRLREYGPAGVRNAGRLGRGIRGWPPALTPSLTWLIQPGALCRPMELFWVTCKQTAAHGSEAQNMEEDNSARKLRFLNAGS